MNLQNTQTKKKKKYKNENTGKNKVFKQFSFGKAIIYINFIFIAKFKLNYRTCLYKKKLITRLLIYSFFL